MEKLFISLENEILRARKVESYETLTSPLVWQDIEFEYTHSRLLMINWPILLPELSPHAARSFLNLVGARYQFSPNYEKLKSLCPELIFTKESDEWVFFGGSFNPWHKGHQACLDLLPSDKLCFILPDRNPLKELQEVEPVSTIIKLVTQIKFGPNHFIAPTFLTNMEKNPTITWIERLKYQFPDKKLSLLLGFDGLKNIKNWIRAEELLKSLDTLYVASRLENDHEHEIMANALKDISAELKIVYLGRHHFEAISSSRIRNQR